MTELDIITNTLVFIFMIVVFAIGILGIKRIEIKDRRERQQEE